MGPDSYKMSLAIAAAGSMVAVAAHLNGTDTATRESGFVEMHRFMVEPVSTWTMSQMLIFPWLFIIPAEIFAGMSSLLIYFKGNVETDLPHGKTTHLPLGWRDLTYIWFNRLVVLPFLSFLIVKVVWNSSAIVWEPEQLSFQNGLLAFVGVFSLSDLTYYTGHRIVHKYKWLYKFVHKHHHGESAPIRGWADTCNAHPTDFFYTGFTTSPLSTLWLFPAGSVHIYVIAACLWINAFVGALGHCRLDFNVGFFNTRFHAGHHANSTCNFAQNVEIWDRLFGTYRDLNVSQKKAALKKGD